MVNRKYFLGFCLTVLTITLMHCAKKFEFSPSENTMVIDSISPARGTENTQVRIYGKNFPVDTAKLSVFFNGKKGLIIDKSTNNVILASVPAEAGTGTIRLKNGENDINGPVFTYDFDAPVISSISPLTGIIGTELVINGKKFSATATNNKVEINGVLATILSSSTTQIKATVPVTKNGPVKVTSNGISNQGSVFKFIPQIVSADKTTAYVGDALTISGNYFDVGTDLKVTFNGVLATITSSNATGITVKVPASTTGNIVVAVDGVASNAIAFTYRIAPTISGLSKNSAFAQDTLTIYGNNFVGSTAPVVSFNSIPATVINTTNSQIKVRIPAGTSGNVVVAVDGINSNGVPFTYLQNIIANSLNQVTPVLRIASGIDGATVSINGSNFGTQSNRIRVTVGNQEAQITGVNNSVVTFVVPVFNAGSGNSQFIKIYLDNVEATYPNGTLSFNYLEPTILSTTCSIAQAIGLPAGYYTFTYIIDGNNYNSTAPNANFEVSIDGTKRSATVNNNRATVVFTQASTLKNRYDIQVKNKWGGFISAFQRDVTISDFSYYLDNSKNTISITGEGFGSTDDLNRSVRVYRIINGVKNYLTVNSTSLWSDKQLIVTFSDAYLDDLTYGVEVRVNTRPVTTKEKFIDYYRVN